MSNFAMPVSEFMSEPVYTTGAGKSLRDAHDTLQLHGVSCLAVVDGDKPVGVISRTDLIREGRVEGGRRPKASLLTLPDKDVSDIMTPHVTTVSPDTTIREASAMMVDQHVHRVFVARKDKLVGVLSTKDVMEAIAQEKVRHPIAQYMSTPVFTIRSHEPISLATERLERAHVSGLVVVDEGWPVGVFTQVESLLSADMPRDTPVEAVHSPAMLCMNVDIHVHRAAAQAAATRARRVIVTEDREVRGIMTGIDFAKATLPR